MALEPAKLTDFKLAGALGTGTTAKVYEAVHLSSNRPVAIKMMEQASSSSEMRERFAREAILLSGVESRHVSRIIGFGFDKGQPFLVLERLHGETLDAKLRRDGAVPPPLAVRWIEQLIVGVRDCHDAKIIHRDIKPSNIFLHHDGFDEVVKLIDFGVARLREITDGDSGGLTSTNHLIGSMGYMAPEQFRSAKTVGFPADLYAVGVVIFRTLTGRLPFVSRSLEAVIKMKSEQVAPAISAMNNQIHNPLLDWFVQKAMMREPEERFQSAREMLEHWWNVVASLDEDGTTDIMRGIGRVDESYAGPLRRDPIRDRDTARPATAPPPTMPHSQPLTQGAGPPSSSPHPADQDERTIRRPPRGPVALPSQIATAPSSSGGGGGGGNEYTMGQVTQVHGSLPLQPQQQQQQQPHSHSLTHVSSRPQSSEQHTMREQDAPRTIPSQDLGALGAQQAPNTHRHPPVMNLDDTTATSFQVSSDDVPISEGEMVEGEAVEGEGTEGDDPFDLPTRNDPNLRKLVERELELQKARKRGG
jgi:serine/threonine protein kinase